jgi:hypothetical protein
MSKLKFFKVRETKERILDEFSSRVKMEEFTAGNCPIYFGDPGDKFYVLLKGKCTIWLPIPLSR